MRSAEQVTHESTSSERTALHLEDLVAIGVVIGAGCEGCTESLVMRARRRDTPETLIARTLAIAARVCSVECLVRAVGPEVVGRMRRSVQAGEKAFRQAHGGVKDRGCCG
jgi:hypothetical protein